MTRPMLILWVMMIATVIGNPEAEQELRKKLLKDYDKETMPATNTTITISSINVLNLKMHEEEHTVDIHALLRHSWEDLRLAWSLEENMQVGIMGMDPEDIWTPDLTIYNAAKSSEHMTHSHMPTIVFPDGSVLNVPSVNLRFTCVMDLTYWPHDTHNCSLEIGSWVHNGHQLDMQLEASGLEMDISSGVGEGGKNLSLTEWRLEEAKLSRAVKKFRCCDEPYVSVIVNIRVTRDAPVYAWTVKMPAACLTLLTLVVFLLPPAAGEKVVFGGLCLILDTIFIGYCTSVVGHAPTHTPLIVLMVCQQFLILVLGIIVASVVLRMSREVYACHLPSVMKGPLLAISYFLCLGSYRSLVSKSYQSFAFFAKQDELEIGEGGAQDLHRRRENSDAHEWFLLGAVVNRLALLLSVAVCVISLIRFSCVL
ncbi:neuronal acetylcholine receptor subunit alpha-7-like [Penaeus monodon]|uniref:neuronal acetylcholine receptor subunit alpha-7-like n=1 Tax=Penaeus monodon TaxID=6687 RepID=UPI0018A79727|nr:neuronal acetylcholine receptor subunit alpha-7-like [Penaeus monodon]